MIRFYKSYLGRALLGLLILIELEKATDKYAVADQVRKWTAPDPTHAQTVELLLDNYIQGYPDESPTNDEVVKGAFGQLLKKRNDDADLLDVIVNALKLPFTHSFGVNGLKALREVVLTPSEIVDLKRIYRQVGKCACGYEFSSNEMASVTVSGDTITLKCTKCSRPQIGRCDHCGQPVGLLGSVAAKWRTDIDCGCRKKIERASKAPAAAQTAAYIGNPTGGLSLAQVERFYRNTATLGHPTPRPKAPLSMPIFDANPPEVDVAVDDGGF